MNPKPPPNVLITDNVSKKLRNQTIFVINGYLSELEYSDSSELYYSAIDYYNYLAGNDPCRERNNSTMSDMLKKMDSAKFLDFLDVICNTFLEDSFFCNRYGQEFTEEINDVLITNSMGYIVAGKQLIPNTDVKEAEEIVIPAFHTLSSLGMNSACENLEVSYEHFKNRNNSEAILSAFKALESAVDFMLKELSAEYIVGDRFPNKIQLLGKKLEIPTYLVSDFNKLIDLMKAPGEIRNKLSGHGTADTAVIPNHFVKYEIDLVASNILFLARTYQSINILTEE